MRVLVRCPTDGAVEVTIADIDGVVIRSGSDVEATYRCPKCGCLIVVDAAVPSELVALLALGAAMPQPSPRSAAEEARIDAYVEYFRREMPGELTVEKVLAQTDVGVPVSGK